MTIRPRPSRRPGDATARSAAQGRTRAEHLAIDDAFQRVAGAPRVPGNALHVLRDARENYPAWIEACSTTGSARCG